MIAAVVDTNVLVRGALSGNPRSASKELVDAFFTGRFFLIISEAALDELLQVLTDAELRVRHGEQTDDQVLDFCEAIEVHGRFIEPTTVIPASVTRDPTDVKWLALAVDGRADYLVTVDNRHLLRLKRFGRTRIVRPRAFLSALAKASN